jgi:hypothetical protein
MLGFNPVVLKAHITIEPPMNQNGIEGLDCAMDVQYGSRYSRQSKLVLSKNRKASLVPASQGWRETFSLNDHCPHPSNRSPIEAHFTGLIESVNTRGVIRLFVVHASGRLSYSSNARQPSISWSANSNCVTEQCGIESGNDKNTFLEMLISLNCE